MEEILLPHNNCYILKTKLPENISVDFEKLWDLCPKDRGILNIYGKKVTVSRYFKAYGHSYAFSGVNVIADPIPNILQPFLDYANNIISDSEKGKLNGILLNWYPDGHSYISAHSDSEKGLKPDSSIVSISLGAQRKFRFRNKIPTEDFKTVKEIVEDIPMPDRTVIIMCGATQRYFTHEVPKITGTLGENTGRRINLTFRIFD